MSSSGGQDYYSVLGISPSATQADIRKAYKVQALKTHPDRVPMDSPERPARTAKFQLVNDAYYTLSDVTRRRQYDATRQSRTSGSTSGFSGFPGFSGFSSASNPGPSPSGSRGRPKGGWQDEQFGDIFEEMMNEEGFSSRTAGATPAAAPTSTAGGFRFWGILGAISGALLGFIVANMAGLFAGAIAGNRLGAIRDRQGKSVYEVFQTMDQGEKAKILSDLAAKVFAQVVS